jgi:hypothetical protein
MANVNKPFGLRPQGNLSATGAQKQYGYQIADNQSGAIFQGDLVTLSAGYIVKFDATLHTVAVGVFNGCNYIDPTSGKPTWKNYYPGSVNITTGYIVADVLDDPNQLFSIQASGTITQAQFGLNAAILYGAGSTTSGVSGTQLNSTGIANTNADGLVLKLVGINTIPTNTLGTNVQVIVKINKHLYGSSGVANVAPA